MLHILTSWPTPVWLCRCVLFRVCGQGVMSPPRCDRPPAPKPAPRYGNFDIVLHRLSCGSQLHATLHAPCGMHYLVPWMLIGACYDGIVNSQDIFLRAVWMGG